jgi:prepilin-type N-terminal cleavage/methylation domain-containing protein
MKNFYTKGFTMIEIIITIVVIGIIVAIVVPQFLRFRNVQVIKSTSQEVVSVLEKARSQTLASLDSSEYGVHFESDKVILFKGVSYLESDPNNEEIEIISPAVISDISLSGSETSVYFNRLTGAPSAFGSVQISIASQNIIKTINVSQSGVISLN